MIRRILLALAAAVLLAAPAWADSCKIEGLGYSNVIFQGFKDGQITLQTSTGRPLSESVKKFDTLAMTDYPDVAQAENALAAGDFKKAAGLYNKALAAVGSKTDLRRIVEARAIKAYDGAGQWTDAVKTFLGVYQASPTAGTFELRPTKLPEATSKMLEQSADYIITGAKSFKTPEAEKSLKIMLLDIYTRANNPKAAELAKELGGDAGPTVAVGPATPPHPTPSTVTTPSETVTPAPSASDDATVTSAETALAGKKYEDVVRIADAAVANANPTNAVRLFTAKAEALKAQKKFAEAALAYLRIAAHYGTNQTQAAEALFQAAQALEQDQKPAEAKRLYREIAEKYRNSSRYAAAVAKAAEPNKP